MESPLYVKNLIYTSVTFNMGDLNWELSVVNKFFQDDDDIDNKDAEDNDDNTSSTQI
jgi:hypothetical protein